MQFDPGFSDHKAGWVESAENPFVAKMSLGDRLIHALNSLILLV